jgi:hypothetical protein
MPNKHPITSQVNAILCRRRGQHGRLIAELEQLPVEALYDLLQVLRDFEQEAEQAKRTYRPFPGGPKIRL